MAKRSGPHTTDDAAGAGQSASYSDGAAPPTSCVELERLLAVVELLATVQGLTLDEAEDVQSLSSWLQDWQPQGDADLSPSIVQFIHDCTCDCLDRAQSRGVATRSDQMRLH